MYALHMYIVFFPLVVINYKLSPHEIVFTALNAFGYKVSTLETLVLFFSNCVKLQINLFFVSLKFLCRTKATLDYKSVALKM